jgi:hypothetical protein
VECDIECEALIGPAEQPRRQRKVRRTRDRKEFCDALNGGK